MSRFAAGDSVILRSVTRGDRYWMTLPLEEGSRIDISSDYVPHDSIIGSKSRSIVKSFKGDSYIATQASTEDYVNLSKRAAQPIYTFDAASIVTLADLHIDFPELTEDGQLKESPLQFLEAGTGHGSLTLAICQRIHAGNAYYKTHGVKGAILHSIDNTQAHSVRGSRNLTTFRRGIYANDVEFHVANSPTQWLLENAGPWRSLEKFEEDASEDDRKEFLSGAFLDMADLTSNIQAISEALKQDSPFILFSPSVTQLLDVLKTVKQSHGQIKLTHIRTIQLVPGAGGGLQDWDLRYTEIRKSGEEGVVCRPRVGSRVVGGGFVAIFKKLPNEAILKTKNQPK